MHGMRVMEEAKEPLPTIPDEVRGLKIALKITGGLGDALMAVGGTARVLADRGAICTAVVMSHQGPLLTRMDGVSEWIGAQKFNDLQLQGQQDVILNFANVFNTRSHLKSGGYYNLVSERVGFKVEPGQFQIDPFDRFDEDTVMLHPGASNPSRRWDNEKWRELAYQIRDRGFKVLWWGTKDEFGFNAEGITKLSDASVSLEWQFQELNKCVYFVGNDSGPCHIAGILKIPGTVIFSATHPDDVIDQYSSLRGVHCFERLGIEPTRSVNPADELAIKAIAALSVEDVLGACDLGAINCTQGSREEVKAVCARLAVVGGSPYLCGFLSQNFDVQIFENMPEFGAEFDVVVEVRGNGYRIRTKKFQNGVNVQGDFENVQRAIREILTSEDNDG